YNGSYALFVNGQFAGPIHSFDGCAPKAAYSTSLLQQQIAFVLTTTPCRLELGVNATANVVDWLTDSLDVTSTTVRLSRDIWILRYEPNTSTFSRVVADSSFITKFAFSADSAAGDPFFTSLEFHTDHVLFDTY